MLRLYRTLRETAGRHVNSTCPPKKLLMVFIEPAPYILDFIKTMRAHWDRPIDILFLQSKRTQRWDVRFSANMHILPDKKGALRAWFKQNPLKKNYEAIFITGWGCRRCLIFFALAKANKLPFVVDSDTPMMPRLGFVKRTLKRVIYPYLFKFPDGFLPAGKRQAAFLKHYKVPVSKITMEKMTVDVLALQAYWHESSNKRPSLREAFGFKANDFIFLFIGRLNEQKGLRELLHVFENLTSDGIKLLLIGDGPLKSLVESTAKKSNAIAYGGWLEKQALWDTYTLCDAFILPAYRESWGLVVNEAMAAGKPVIVSSEVGCADDLVTEHETGLVVPAGNINALKEAILYLAIEIDEDRYSAMSQACLERISEWTLDHQAKQVKYALKKAMCA